MNYFDGDPADQTPAERLLHLFSMPEEAPLPRLNCAINAAKMEWLRHMAKKFCKELPGFTKFAQGTQGEFGGPPEDFTAEDIQNDLTLELILTSMMGIIIAVREELEAVGLGVFKPKNRTVEVVDFSEMGTNQIDEVLGMGDTALVNSLDPEIERQLKEALDAFQKEENFRDILKEMKEILDLDDEEEKRDEEGEAW